MVWLVLWLGNLAAFGLFSMAMAKHRNQLKLAPVSLTRERCYKTIAWLLLALVTVVAMTAQGAAIGLLNNLGVMTLAALAVAIFYSGQKKSRRGKKKQ